MDWERICLFAAHVGTSERLLETAIAYARTRTQFGQPIGKYQAVAHRIADMKVNLEAARLLTYRAAWRLDHARSASLDAAIAKLFVSESLVQAALATVQVHGGYGYMTEYEVERALTRRRGQHDLLGHQRDAAQHHRPLAGARQLPLGSLERELNTP
jgi:alkylation response protein AidB-like acyl-CoA dehydrogenase